MAKKTYKVPEGMSMYRNPNPDQSPYPEDGNPYDPDFMGNNQDRFNQVLEIPEVDNMAGVFARAVFKSDRQRKAAVRLHYRHLKFGDHNHDELLRVMVASTIGINGRGRLDGIFSQTGMLAPDMLRVVADMPKHKKGEDERVIRGSDIRSETKPPETLGGAKS